MLVKLTATTMKFRIDQTTAEKNRRAAKKAYLVVYRALIRTRINKRLTEKTFAERRAEDTNVYSHALSLWKGKEMSRSPYTAINVQESANR